MIQYYHKVEDNMYGNDLVLQNTTKPTDDVDIFGKKKKKFMFYEVKQLR